MKTLKKINIARDYSDTPLGRFPSDGEFSGARFRDEFLIPALNSGDDIVLEIDGVEGYGSSFLEEVFGGLVRTGHFAPKDLHERVKISYKDQAFKLYESLIWRYINEAKSN